MKNKLLKLLHKFYRKDDFINSFLDGVQVILNNVLIVIERLINLLHFNRLDSAGCEWWENFLKIVPTQSQTIAERQAKIREKWNLKNHNNIALLQFVANSWKQDETIVNFVDGKIQIQFVGEYGTPSDLAGLKSALDDVKPAHLAYLFLYKYLLIKDIHEVMTINELQNCKINNFEFGVI